MGASQSARCTSIPKSIPVRPRTPLRFGSVPTPMPVDPYEYNTRPVRNLHANIDYGDSLTSMLSQENYLAPSPEFLSASPEPEPYLLRDDYSDAESSGYSTPGSSHGWGSGYLHFAPPHHNKQPSYSHPPSTPELNVFGWANMADPEGTMLPEITPLNSPQPGMMQSPRQACPCPYCVPAPHVGHPMYTEQWQIYSPSGIPGVQQTGYYLPVQIPPAIVGYQGPEVENLVWMEGERRPEGYGPPPEKRMRMAY